MENEGVSICAYRELPIARAIYLDFDLRRRGPIHQEDLLLGDGKSVIGTSRRYSKTLTSTPADQAIPEGVTRDGNPYKPSFKTGDVDTHRPSSLIEVLLSDLCDACGGVYVILPRIEGHRLRYLD